MRNQLTCSVLQSSVETRVPLSLCFSPSTIAPFRGQALRSARAEVTLCLCVRLCERDQTLSEPCSWLDGVKRGWVGDPRNISRVSDNPADIPDGVHTNANAGTQHPPISWLSNKCKKDEGIKQVSIYFPLIRRSLIYPENLPRWLSASNISALRQWQSRRWDRTLLTELDLTLDE